MIISVVSAGVLLTILLAWYFFGPRKTTRAQMQAGVQVVRIRVKGGYSPDVVEVRRGAPVQLLFDRQEAGECTSRVVIPAFRINALLPAYQTTAVDLIPDEAGEYGFACGMNMISGTLKVTEVGPSEVVAGVTPNPPASVPTPTAAGFDAAAADDAEQTERRAEIADLPRRVGFGAVFTAPVLFAVISSEFFGATWLPEVLLERWFQLALIAPVMLYTGWPIHRTGWLALSHRSADMNSLITLGTTAAFGYSLVVTLVPGILPANVREVYYEAVGVILTLILLGRLLESKAKAGTGEAIRTLIGLQPHTARVMREEVEVEVPVEDVVVGDVVVVRVRSCRLTERCCRARRRWMSRW